MNEDELQESLQTFLQLEDGEEWESLNNLDRDPDDALSDTQDATTLKANFGARILLNCSVTLSVDTPELLVVQFNELVCS